MSLLSSFSILFSLSVRKLFAITGYREGFDFSEIPFHQFPNLSIISSESRGLIPKSKKKTSEISVFPQMSVWTAQMHCCTIRCHTISKWCLFNRYRIQSFHSIKYLWICLSDFKAVWTLDNHGWVYVPIRI